MPRPAPPFATGEENKTNDKVSWSATETVTRVGGREREGGRKGGRERGREGKESE